MNIRLFACALLSACVFVSCHSDKTVEDIETVSYTFQVINPITGSLDDFDTRAGEASTPLYLCVYDVPDREAPNDVVYRENDVNALAPIKLQLTPGKHRICFLCSKTKWNEIDKNALVISWNDNLDDVWSTVVDIDAQTEDANTNQTVQLSRAVAYVCVTIKDALPKWKPIIYQKLEGGTRSFDMLNQVGGVASMIEVENQVTSSDANTTNRVFGIYTFVPEGVESASSYTIEAREGFQKLYWRTFTDVPLVQNQYTNYVGELFTPNNQQEQMSFSLEYDWKQSNIIPF